MRRRERGLQSGINVFILPDAGRTERTRKTPLPCRLRAEPNADGAKPQQNGGDIRTLRIERLARGFQEQFGRRKVCGRRPQTGGQAAELPCVQEGQIAHARHRGVAEGYAGVTGEPFAQGVRGDGVKDADAGERHLPIEEIRRGRIQPKPGQAHRRKPRQQRIGVGTFLGQERKVVIRRSAGIAAGNRLLVTA